MKIGDKVKIINTNDKYIGKKGIITSNEKCEFCYKKQRYWVKLNNSFTYWFCYNELEVIL